MLLLALSACGHATVASTDTAAPVRAAVHTAVAATPTASPEATATALPTPIPSPTPRPPTPTPNAVATASAIDARFPGYGYDFAYRPIAFQIDNAPEAWPQTGLSQAYVVYETIAEGGVTRYTAIFVRKHEPKIGNLRSARLVDLDVAPQWNAILAHVGASTPVMNLLWTSKIPWMNLDDPRLRQWSWRTTDRVAPYNLYASLGRIRQLAESKSVPVTTTDPRYFPVGPAPTGGKDAMMVTVPYEAPGQVLFQYDRKRASYLRWIDGKPQIDARDGKQITVKNVIVLFAREKVTNIIEDRLGSRSLQFHLDGSGKAIIARGGKAFDATWHHPQLDQLTTFTDATGATIKLAPGTVWIEIVPATMPVTVR